MKFSPRRYSRLSMAFTLLVMAFIFFIMASNRAFAICSDVNSNDHSAHELPGQGYWMQAMGKCRITYTGYDGEVSQLFNYCTNRSEQITRDIDAFPVPGFDDDLYVHGTLKGLFFNSLKANKESLVSGLAQPDPVKVDKGASGTYQSLGVISRASDGLSARIRVFADRRGGRTRDYLIEKKPKDLKNQNPYKIELIEKSVKPVCKDQWTADTYMQVPMLSRDGRKISVQNPKTMKTDILEIRDDGHCPTVASIPSIASKTSFSFDNRFVAYKVIDPLTLKGRLMVLDLKTKKSLTVSAPGEDVLYFAHREDGALIYSKRNPERSVGTSSGNEAVSNQFSSEGIDSPQTQVQGLETSRLIVLNRFNFEAFFETAEKEKNRRNKELLGLLWGAKCGAQFDLDFAYLAGYRLNRESCKKIVSDPQIIVHAKNTWKNDAAKPFIDRLNSLKAAEMTRLCDSTVSPGPIGPTGAATKRGERQAR